MGRKQSEATRLKLGRYMSGRKRGTYKARCDLRVVMLCVLKNGCAECISHTRDKDGYSLWCVKGRRSKKRMSRVIYEEKFGELERGVVLRHSCDNRACVNLDHLSEGSNADNSKDMVSRNRQAKGSKVGTSILREKDVVKIRELYSTGRYSQVDLGKRFGVDQTTISLIVIRKLWRHVC